MKTKEFRGTGGVFYETGVTIYAEYCFLDDICKCINLMVTMLDILQMFCWSCEFDICLEIFRT